MRQDLLYHDSKVTIMVVNDLHVLQNVNKKSDKLEALIGAVFFDSDYSLKAVWDVINLLLRQYTGKSIY